MAASGELTMAVDSGTAESVGALHMSGYPDGT